jgi:hypothetical protein
MAASACERPAAAAAMQNAAVLPRLQSPCASHAGLNVVRLLGTRSVSSVGAAKPKTSGKIIQLAPVQCCCRLLQARELLKGELQEH